MTLIITEIIQGGDHLRSLEINKDELFHPLTLIINQIIMDGHPLTPSLIQILTLITYLIIMDGHPLTLIINQIIMDGHPLTLIINQIIHPLSF